MVVRLEKLLYPGSFSRFFSGLSEQGSSEANIDMSTSMILSHDLAADRSVDPFRGIWSAVPFPLLVIMVILVVILKSVKKHSPM